MNLTPEDFAAEQDDEERAMRMLSNVMSAAIVSGLALLALWLWG